MVASDPAEHNSTQSGHGAAPTAASPAAAAAAAAVAAAAAAVRHAGLRAALPGASCAEAGAAAAQRREYVLLVSVGVAVLRGPVGCVVLWHPAVHPLSNRPVPLRTHQQVS